MQGKKGVNETTMLVDNRERNVAIIEGLASRGVELNFAQLPVGDYILSERVCIERKTVSDFDKSIMDARLFEQLDRLSKGFAKPLLVIEGAEEEHQLNKNVIDGAVASVFLDYNVQVVRTRNEDDTVALLVRLAEREQQGKGSEPRILGSKRANSTGDWQILILSSIPGIGPKLAKSLITKFKSIRNIAMANPEALQEVEKIGKKKAEQIHRIINAEFDDMGVDTNR